MTIYFGRKQAKNGRFTFGGGGYGGGTTFVVTFYYTHMWDHYSTSVHPSVHGTYSSARRNQPDVRQGPTCDNVEDLKRVDASRCCFCQAFMKITLRRAISLFIFFARTNFYHHVNQRHANPRRHISPEWTWIRALLRSSGVGCIRLAWSRKLVPTKYGLAQSRMHEFYVQIGF